MKKSTKILLIILLIDVILLYLNKYIEFAINNIQEWFRFVLIIAVVPLIIAFGFTVIKRKYLLIVVIGILTWLTAFPAMLVLGLIIPGNGYLTELERIPFEKSEIAV